MDTNKLFDSITLPFLLHYFMHLIFPFILSRILFPGSWKKAGLVMLLTMVIDLDHLFADPVYDPGRCSIQYHPLHTFQAAGIYLAGLFYYKTRWIALGLILHVSVDFADCLFSFADCQECYLQSWFYKHGIFSNYFIHSLTSPALSP